MTACQQQPLFQDTWGMNQSTAAASVPLLVQQMQPQAPQLKDKDFQTHQLIMALLSIRLRP